jgi:hypothetical protein
VLIGGLILLCVVVPNCLLRIRPEKNFDIMNLSVIKSYENLLRPFFIADYRFCCSLV